MHGSIEPSKYAVAFKSFKAKKMWHLTEAHYNKEIQDRTRREENGAYPFEYFDSVAMLSIQHPQEWVKRNIVDTTPSPPLSHTFPAPTHARKDSLLKLQESSVGENAGRGVFSTIDISANSYLGF